MYTLPALKDSPELNEVYRLYGIAAHHCANIEYRLLMFLFDPMWASTPDLTQEKIEKIQQEIYRMPLGQLITQIKRHYALDDKQENYLKEVLGKRNYLMHRFFGNHGTKMHLPKTLLEMKEELTELIVLLQSASLWLDQQVQDYLARVGLLPALRKRFTDMLGSNNSLESDAS